MSRPSFEIYENHGTVELRASGEISGSVNIFRLHLLKLLQHGKSKSYRLDLKRASAVDASCIQLIYILKRELSAVNASLVVDMPDESEVKYS